MNISGILVVAGPQRHEEVARVLAALPGVDIHQIDAASSRIVITQEAADIHAEIAGLRHIQALPHVVMAEMVYHYIGEDQRQYEALPDELTAQDSSCAVPEYLTH
jgi:nitrate reductase NapD